MRINGQDYNLNNQNYNNQQNYSGTPINNNNNNQKKGHSWLLIVLLAGIPIFLIIIAVVIGIAFGIFNIARDVAREDMVGIEVLEEPIEDKRPTFEEVPIEIEEDSEEDSIEVKEESIGIEDNPIEAGKVGEDVKGHVVGIEESWEQKANSSENGLVEIKKSSDTEELKFILTGNNSTYNSDNVARIKDVDITVNSISIIEDDLFEAEPGYEFVSVELEIKNKTNKDKSISSLLLFDAFVNGNTKCEYSIIGQVCSELDSVDTVIPKGESHIGGVCYLLPIGWEKLEIGYTNKTGTSAEALFVFER